MTHRRYNFLYAVKKSTREVTPLVRERVLLWYKGKGSEMEHKLQHNGEVLQRKGPTSKIVKH